MLHLVEKSILSNIPTIASNAKAGDIVKHLTDKRHNYDSISYIYVVDDKKLKGVISIKELLKIPINTPVKKIMKTGIISISPHATVERASILAIQNNIKAVPVVERGEFLGIVGNDVIIHTLHLDHTEDLLRIGGVQITEQKHFAGMVSARAGHLVKARIPWLALGLVLGFLSPFVVSRFESKLSETVALAFFMPLIVYMAAAVGSQTQTIFIRSSTIQKFSVLRYFFKEILIDIMLAVILAIPLGLYVFAFMRDARLALAVSVALVGAVFFSVFIGIGIPTLLKKFKKDPAIGAGPFGTIIQDITTLLVYFAVVSLLL